jgi:hypothetical protein
VVTNPCVIYFGIRNPEEHDYLLPDCKSGRAEPILLTLV